MNTQEKFELFIEGLLDDEESKEFKKQLEDDPELMMEFKKYNYVNRLLQRELDTPLLNDDDDPDLKSLSLEQKLMIDDAVDEYFRNNKQVSFQGDDQFREAIGKNLKKYPERSFFSKIKSYYKIAAIFILGLICSLIIIRYVTPSYRSIDAITAYKQFYDPLNDKYFKSSGSYNMNLQRAIIAFRKADYPSAISILDEISDDYDTEYNYKILRGLILLEKGESMKARELFMTAMQKSETDSRYAARWYLGLSLLRENKTEDALPFFRELGKIRNPYRADAKKILRTVKWN